MDNLQITFPELQEKFTLNIMKKCVKLAEGFELTSNPNFIDCPYGYEIDLRDMDSLIGNILLFSTLLHRAVEGWNKQELINGNYISFGTYAYTLAWGGGLKREVKPFEFENYQPCHLTACEMAIWHCLLEVLG